MMSQNPETSIQNNHSLKSTFASEDVWTEGYTVRHIMMYYSFHDEMFFQALGVCVCVCVCVLFGNEVATVKGGYQETGK